VQKKALQTSEADARIRTADPFITSEVLYQLSYVGGAVEYSRETSVLLRRKRRAACVVS
jgi:hypothetical protein